MDVIESYHLKFFIHLFIFILLASALSVFSVPYADAANANLFVSAENSQFVNYMSGPQVIEVVVIDSDINDTDEVKGEPDVTVNGKILRMVQAVDGNWYGYFADRNMAQIADSTVTGNTPGEGLDFGYFCDNTLTIGDPNTTSFVSFTDTVGVAIDEVVGGAADGSPTGGPITNVCGTDIAGSATDDNNIVREAKHLSLTASATLPTGQIGVDENLWPFIQLYNLNPTGNVVIQYNKGGGVQTTILTFDTVGQLASFTLNSILYQQNSQVLVTVTDLWLNVDPTDEDSWTFGTNAANSTSKGTYYQVFDENGNLAGASVTLGTINIVDTLPSLMCEDNCRLLVNTNQQNSANPVLTVQDNGDSAISLTGLGGINDALSFSADGFGSELLGTGSIPVTITEQGPNSGVFHTYDESNISVLRITSDAVSGSSATINYNEKAISFFVFSDADSDGILDQTDNCPSIANSRQLDRDNDGLGDACDIDIDNDTILNNKDNCALVANLDQKNTDGDSKGNACDTDDDNDGIVDRIDNCQFIANPDQANADGDKRGDACDAYPNDPA